VQGKDTGSVLPNPPESRIQRRRRKQGHNTTTETTKIMLERCLLSTLLLLTSPLSSASSSSAHHVFSTRKAINTFLPRGGASSSSSTVFATRQRAPSSLSTLSSAPSSTSSIKNVIRRKKKNINYDLDEEDLDNDYYSSSHQHVLQSQNEQEPTLEELRAQLGPIAIFVSNTIELTVTTLGSYISGGLLGYIGGGALSIPNTLFDKTITGGFGARLGALHSKAWGTSKNWGMLSAAFSGFHNFVRLCRGGVEDGWNAVWGSGLTGAFLNRSGEFCCGVCCRKR
jgi:hypothetical protein